MNILLLKNYIFFIKEGEPYIDCTTLQRMKEKREDITNNRKTNTSYGNRTHTSKRNRQDY